MVVPDQADVDGEMCREHPKIIMLKVNSLKNSLVFKVWVDMKNKNYKKKYLMDWCFMSSLMRCRGFLATGYKCME